MDLKISDLPPQFENIANRLGIEKVKCLFEEFGGTSVYFPTKKMIYKECRDREIFNEFNEFNIKELDSYNDNSNFEKVTSNMVDIKNREKTPCDITNNLKQVILKVDKKLVAKENLGNIGVSLS